MSEQDPQHDSTGFFASYDFSNMPDGYPPWTEDHGLGGLHEDFNHAASTTNGNASIDQIEHNHTSQTPDNAGPVALVGSSPHLPRIYHSNNPLEGQSPRNHTLPQHNVIPANPSSMRNSVQLHNGAAEAKLEEHTASSPVYFDPNGVGLVPYTEAEYGQALLDYTALERSTNSQALDHQQAGTVINRPLANELLGHGYYPALYQTNGMQMANGGTSGNTNHGSRGPVSDFRSFDNGLSPANTNLADPTSGSMIHTSRVFHGLPNVARGQPSSAIVPPVTADNSCQMYPSPNESMYNVQLKTPTMGMARVTQNPAGLLRPSNYGYQQTRSTPAGEHYHAHSPQDARSLQGPRYKYSANTPTLNQHQQPNSLRYRGNPSLANHMYSGHHHLAPSAHRMEPLQQPDMNPMFNTAAANDVGNSTMFEHGTPAAIGSPSPHPGQELLDRSLADGVNRPSNSDGAGTGPGEIRPAQRYGRGNPMCADCRNTFKRMPGDDPNKDRCKRHWEAYLKSLKPPPVFTMDAAIPGSEAARDEVFPTALPLTIPDDDWEVQDEDHWVARFIAAINRPYLSNPHTDAQYGTDQWLLQQQKELNMKPAQDSSVLRGSYTDRAVTARVRLLYMCVRTYHAGGVPPYPAGGDNWGYIEDPNLKCSSRLAEIEQHLSIDKRICMNVIEGRGVHAFAQSPQNYLTRKNANSRSNTKKREYIAVGKNAAAEQTELPEVRRPRKRVRMNGD